MITKLTKAQIERFPEFVEKWIKIGLSTELANRPEAEAGVNLAYKIAGLEPPRIVWCGSPFSQGLTRALVFGMKPSEVGASVRASVRASVWDSVWDSVGDSVWDSVWASVGDSVRASVGASVGDSVWASVRASVGDSGYGQHDANWLGFYDYFRTVCELNQETQKLLGLWSISQNAGWFLPYKKLCWISERHNVLKRNLEGRLHCTNGPALQYPDGWSIYALNGVRIPGWIVEQPTKLNGKSITDEKNVEIRREMLRLYGVERFIQDVGAKTIHKAGTYELLSVGLSDDLKDARFLKMLNPSIGVWHVERVGLECKTVQEALHWRKPDALRAIPVSEDGEDWYQQGDVCIWPKTAKSVKPRPAKLT